MSRNDQTTSKFKGSLSVVDIPAKLSNVSDPTSETTKSVHVQTLSNVGILFRQFRHNIGAKTSRAIKNIFNTEYL